MSNLIKGIAASDGVAIAKAYLLVDQIYLLTVMKRSLM